MSLSNAGLSGPDQPQRIVVGDAAFARVRYALFASGFTIFALLYYIQSLLPVFSQEFGVSPAQSSLALSATTGVMAFALLVSGAVSDALGRKGIMVLSLLSSSVLTIAMAFSPNWMTVLGIRFLMGITLCGVQSVTMAYLAEELEPKAFAASVGLFIAGSALGGLGGRMASSILSDHLGWRMSVAIIGAIGLGFAVYFRAMLPASRNFVPRTKGWGNLAEEAKIILTNPRLLRLFLVGFAIMSGFVTTYNFITYRLVAPPFNLSQTQVGLIFVVYVFGSAGAIAAGRLSGRFGREPMLWKFQIIMIAGIVLTTSASLWIIVAGLATLTFGMFASHSVASGWVGVEAHRGKALAASLYLFAYYQGGSLIGTLGGVFFLRGGWLWVVALTGFIGLIGLVIGLTLKRK